MPSAVEGLRFLKKGPLVFATTLAALETALFLLSVTSKPFLTTVTNSPFLNTVANIVFVVGWPGLFVGMFFQGLAGGSLHGGGKLWVLVLGSGVANLLLLYGLALLFRDFLHRLNKHQ